MVKFDRPTSQLATRQVAETSDGGDIWPALMNVYQEQGFETGYSRGVNDTLAAALEATEEFVRLQQRSNLDARRLLYAFCEFLESHIRRTPPQDSQRFIDGLGI
jgi:hypothetical protein